MWVWVPPDFNFFSVSDVNRKFISYKQIACINNKNIWEIQWCVSMENMAIICGQGQLANKLLYVKSSDWESMDLVL